MKIAVPTNDQDTITPRSGRTKGFLVFTIDNSVVTDSEYRVNPHKHDHEKGEKHDHSHGDMVKALEDCEVMVGNRVGSHLKKDLDDADISFFVSKKKKVTDAVHEFLSQL